ncbi:hypothetical protein [Maribacter sp. MAR_2009_72]|nr:hypothetical protein [Maribacter sp. MAR_2009_72]
MKFSLRNYRKNECDDVKMEKAIAYKLNNLVLIEFQIIDAYQQED